MSVDLKKNLRILELCLLNENLIWACVNQSFVQSLYSIKILLLCALDNHLK